VGIADQGLSQASSNKSSDDQAKENPGALAGATGAHGVNETGEFRRDDTRRGPLAAMAKLGKPAHKSVSRALYYALTLADFEAWAAFRLLLAARLSTVERAALAYAVLSSLDDSDGYLVASFVLYGGEVGGHDHARH
jgi:hypothetical protein